MADYKVKLSNTMLSPDYNQPLNRKLLLCKLWQKYYQFQLVEGNGPLSKAYVSYQGKMGGGVQKILNLEFPSISMAPIDELTCFESLSLITPLPRQF